MRSIWNGAVSFGLVNVPVRLYSATQSHDIRFHQVHRDDGGRIRYKRTCTECGKEIAYDDIVKGYESTDGQLVTVTDEEFDELPVPSGHEIDVVEFVDTGQVDPMLLDRSYYLEPDSKAIKAYTLLRETLANTDRMAVVKVTLRKRESLAVLHVRDRVIVLQTMRWPDEVRRPAFDVLDKDVDLRDQELSTAGSLVEAMTSDFEPEQFEDEYTAAVEHLIETKIEGGDVSDLPKEKASSDSGEVVDLMSALQRSVEGQQKDGASKQGRQSTKKGAKKSSSKKSTSKKSTSKKSTSKKKSA